MKKNPIREFNILTFFFPVTHFLKYNIPMMSGATGSFRPGKQTCLNQTRVLQYFALYAVKTCPHVGFTQVASAERKRFHRCWWPIWKHLRHVNLLEFTQAGTFADLKAADGCFRKYTSELAHLALVSALVRYSQIICFCGCWIFYFFGFFYFFYTLTLPQSVRLHQRRGTWTSQKL